MPNQKERQPRIFFCHCCAVRYHRVHILLHALNLNCLAPTQPMPDVVMTTAEESSLIPLQCQVFIVRGEPLSIPEILFVSLCTCIALSIALSYLLPQVSRCKLLSYAQIHQLTLPLPFSGLCAGMINSLLATDTKAM